MKKRSQPPEIVLKDGKPSAVILDIGDYEEILERLEQIDDLKALRSVRRRPLRFQSLKGFLQETGRGV